MGHLGSYADFTFTKRQEYYLENECVCGALPGFWLPQLAFDPWLTTQSPEGSIGSPAWLTVARIIYSFMYR